MEFDDKWISDYESLQSNKRSHRLLKIFYCYVDKNNTLHKINQEIIEINNNRLSRDELVKLIVTNKKKHQLLSILSYIVGEIDNHTDFSSLLKSTSIQEIEILPCHNAMDGVNSVFFIFKEYSKKLKSNGTKKVFISSSRNTRRKGLKASSTEEI